MPTQTETDTDPSQLRFSIVSSENNKTSISAPFELTATGIKIPDNLTYEEWCRGLLLFKWAKRHIQLGWADYLEFGRKKFGQEKVDLRLSQLEFALPEVNTAIAFNTIPPEVRKENLVDAHYAVLSKSGLDDEGLAEWATKASENNLDPSTLKASIKQGEIVSPEVARSQQHGIITIHGIAQEFDVWLRRVGGVEGVKKMEPQSIKEIVQLLSEMVKLHMELTN